LAVSGGDGLVHLGASVAIAGSSDSGLPVTLSLVSGPARLENGRLIPTGAGTVRLKATQAGDSNWAAAAIEVERVVAKATQSVTWEGVRDLWGQSAKTKALKEDIANIWRGSSSPDAARFAVAERLGKPIRRVYAVKKKK
jgi:hypothetical protein